MLDWFSGVVGYSSSHLKPDLIACFKHDGQIVWKKEKRLAVAGSYSTSFQVGKQPSNQSMQDVALKQHLLCSQEALMMSGNPTKFLQGHNVFGPDVSMLSYIVQDTCRAFPAAVKPHECGSLVLPAIHTTRIDITAMINMGSHQLVHDWLRTAESSTRSRHGRAMMDGDTVYWGKHSTRWAMKAYCKYCEMKRHPADVDNAEEIRQYTRGLLRLELTLRTPELKKVKELKESLLWDYMSKIEVGVMKAETLEKSPNLSTGQNLALSYWTSGSDVRQMLPQRTFYHYRRRILDELGVDISLPYNRKQSRRETFDLEYLKAHEIKNVPADFPGLVYRPALFK